MLKISNKIHHIIFDHIWFVYIATLWKIAITEDDEGARMNEWMKKEMKHIAHWNKTIHFINSTFSHLSILYRNDDTCISVHY